MSKNDDDVDDERKSPNTHICTNTFRNIEKNIILKNISYYVRERDEAIKSGGDDERQQFLQQ